VAIRAAGEAVFLKKAVCLGLSFLCLLLSACGGGSHRCREEFLRLRSGLLGEETARLRAAVRADYGERIYDFVLAYEGGEASGVLTVEEPAEIGGVEVLLDKDGVTLRCGEALLDTGEILRGLSPLEAFPLLLRAWRSGCVTDCWHETWDGEACLTAQFDLTAAGEADETLCRTRFRLPEGQPVTAEFTCAGRIVLSCTFLSPEGEG
jgi:hypothetical protein